MRRFKFGLPLSLGLATLGFALGGTLAAQVIPAGQGLAGGAMAAMYALAGGALGLVGGFVMAARLAPERLPAVTTIAVVLGLGAIGMMVWQKRKWLREREIASQPVPPARDASGEELPPPLPAPGAPDSLIALVTAPPESLARFETREHGYEETSIVVYGERGNWFLVGLREGGRAWLHTRATGRIFRLEELLPNRLNWLTEAWDTHLRETPAFASPASEAPVPRAGGQEVPATVVETRWADSTLWLRVDVLNDSPCEGGTPKVIASGWIPAWGRDGKPTAWFYSRGC